MKKIIVPNDIVTAGSLIIMAAESYNAPELRALYEAETNHNELNGLEEKEKEPAFGIISLEECSNIVLNALGIQPEDILPEMIFISRDHLAKSMLSPSVYDRDPHWTRKKILDYYLAFIGEIDALDNHDSPLGIFSLQRKPGFKINELEENGKEFLHMSESTHLRRLKSLSDITPHMVILAAEYSGDFYTSMMIGKIERIHEILGYAESLHWLPNVSVPDFGFINLSACPDELKSALGVYSASIIVVKEEFFSKYEIDSEYMKITDLEWLEKHLLINCLSLDWNFSAVLRVPTEQNRLMNSCLFSNSSERRKEIVYDWLTKNCKRNGKEFTIERDRGRDTYKILGNKIWKEMIRTVGAGNLEAEFGDYRSLKDMFPSLFPAYLCEVKI